MPLTNEQLLVKIGKGLRGAGPVEPSDQHLRNDNIVVDGLDSPLSRLGPDVLESEEGLRELARQLGASIWSAVAFTSSPELIRRAYYALIGDAAQRALLQQVLIDTPSVGSFLLGALIRAGVEGVTELAPAGTRAEVSWDKPFAENAFIDRTVQNHFCITSWRRSSLRGEQLPELEEVAQRLLANGARRSTTWRSIWVLGAETVPTPGVCALFRVNVSDIASTIVGEDRLELALQLEKFTQLGSSRYEIRLSDLEGVDLEKWSEKFSKCSNGGCIKLVRDDQARLVEIVSNQQLGNLCRFFEGRQAGELSARALAAVISSDAKISSASLAHLDEHLEAKEIYTHFLAVTAGRGSWPTIKRLVVNSTNPSKYKLLVTRQLPLDGDDDEVHRMLVLTKGWPSYFDSDGSSDMKTRLAGRLPTKRALKKHPDLVAAYLASVNATYEHAKELVENHREDRAELKAVVDRLLASKED